MPELDSPPQVAARLAAFGSTIFTEMSRLAQAKGAVNLGQGFPDFDGPDFVKDAAIAAIRAGHGQYARMFGVPELNRCIARRFAEAGGDLAGKPRVVTGRVKKKDVIAYFSRRKEKEIVVDPKKVEVKSRKAVS